VDALEDVTTYNNFYEFGMDKGDPARHSKAFRTKPWTVKIDGLVNKPATITWKTSWRRTHSRSASIASGASRPGRW